MIHKMTKAALNILGLFLHIPFLVAVYFFWQPFSRWYLEKIPALGVDLYFSTTYLVNQLRYFSLPFNSFLDFWFGGFPLFGAYPQLVFYLMMPFVGSDGPVVGVQKFTVFAALFLIASCYLLFFKLSKNHGIALFLSVLVLVSPNIYGSATWAGSIPYFASQTFFPLGLLAGSFYLENANLRYLGLSILLSGVGTIIHPLGVVTFLIPSLTILVIFGGFYKKFSLKRIAGHCLIFNVGWVASAFLVTHDAVLNSLLRFNLPFLGAGTAKTGGGGDSTAQAKAASEIAQFYKDQVGLLFTQTDSLIFVLLTIGLGLFLLTLIFARNVRGILLVLPFILIAAWAGIHPAINLGNIYTIFRHDPYRAFWQFPIAVSALAAAFLGYPISTFYEKLTKVKYLSVFYFFISLIITVAFVGYAFVVVNTRMGNTLARINRNAEYSSAFPEALGIRFKQKELEELKKELVPTFFDPHYKNARLYSADATVNIWWNALFDMPMARGYSDPPIGTQSRGGFFWLDIAIANDSLTRDFKLDEKTAFNNSLFLIDWYAINYFEGGRLSSKGPSVPPSSYLLKNNVFDKDELVTTHGAVLKYQTASGQPELIPDLPQNLHFFRVADEFASPILYATDATPIAVFTHDPAYEDILRILAYDNINSKRLIPVKGGIIDDLTLTELKNFDAVFLNEYTYKNEKKAFDNLEKYVRDGGKVFIDTGGNVKESDSSSLPEIFPMNSLERKGQGKDWELTSGESSLSHDLDLSKFGPLIFNEEEWNLSTPKDNKLREGSKVLLSHKGKPVLIERTLGKGKVIWSGFNFSYHYNQYKSSPEAELFLRIVKDFVDVSERAPSASSPHWERAEKVSVGFSGNPRGVLFKEQGYDGWVAKANRQNVRIYRAGPTFPGFMYVSLKDLPKVPGQVEFTYRGKRSYWIIAFVNLLAIILALDWVITNGKISRLGVFLARKIFGRRVGRWWSKEDEE